jgi:hypothetical protein
MSSFNNVVRNKLVVISAAVREMREEGGMDPELPALAASQAGLLKRYLDSILSRPDVLAKEMKQVIGAFPDLQQQVDEERLNQGGLSPIDLYIEWLCDACARKS